LDAIDEASAKYLRYEEDKPTLESVETFLGKIGAFVHFKNMTPLQQKLSYIKGIGRNRFGYWDDRSASILLNNYVKALEVAKWDEEDILEDLNKEVERVTKEAKHWSEWKNILEGWIDDIKGWAKKEEKETPKVVEQTPAKTFTSETMSFYSHIEFSGNIDRMEAILHIGTAFPDFDADGIKRDAANAVIAHLRNVEVNDCLGDSEVQSELAEETIEALELMRHFECSEEFLANKNYSQKYEYLKGCAYDLLKQMFYSYNPGYYGLEQTRFKLKTDLERYDEYFRSLNSHC